MAVRLEGTIRRYIGLSTDTKPFIGQPMTRDDGTSFTLASQDLPAGSSFLETDTGRIYRFDGSTNWTYHVPTDDQLQVLQAILFQVTELKNKVAFL